MQAYRTFELFQHAGKWHRICNSLSLALLDCFDSNSVKIKKANESLHKIKPESEEY
jgi:hypothetical protein